MLLDTEVRIHSAVADSYPAYIKLWYVCRALDTNGAGQTVISIKEVAEALDCKPRTIENYLKHGSCLYRRVIKLAPGFYQVYLKSLVQVTLQRGLETFGAVAYATVAEVRKIAVTATEVTAQAGQCASRYQAKVEQKNFANPNSKKRSRKKFKAPLPAEKLFGGIPQFVDLAGPTSEICPGAIGFNQTHKTLFVNSSFVDYGISQAYVAEKLNRSKKTITKRLRNTPKLRIAKFDRLNFIEARVLREEGHPDEGRFLKVKSLEICPNSEALGKTFKLLTNVYYPAYQLTSLARRRRELNAKLAAAVGGTSSRPGRRVAA